MLENRMPWDCGLRQIFLVPSISPGVDISQDRWLFPTERCQMFAQPRSILFQVLSHLLVKYISLARQKIKETAWNYVTLEGSHSHSSPLSFSHVTDISFSAHGRIIDALTVEARCQKQGSGLISEGDFLWDLRQVTSQPVKGSCCHILLLDLLKPKKSWALILRTLNRSLKKMRCKVEEGTEVVLRRRYQEEAWRGWVVAIAQQQLQYFF